MSWPRTPEQLVAEQVRLAGAHPPPFPIDAAGLIGGCFVCFDPADRAFAAAAVLRGRRVLDVSTATAAAGEPYRPGLLALREGPVLERAVRGLHPPPQLLVVNATGRDHPRGAGLAVQLGAVLDLPTVGVTHRPLLATGGAPSGPRGETAPLLLDGALVAAWVVTRSGTRPVAAHAGWRTGVADAVAVALRTSYGRRTPEPLRRARARARALRRLPA